MPDVRIAGEANPCTRCSRTIDSCHYEIGNCGVDNNFKGFVNSKEKEICMNKKIKEINTWLQHALCMNNSMFYSKGKRYPSFALDDPKKIAYFKSGDKTKKAQKVDPFNINFRKNWAVMQKAGRFFLSVVPALEPKQVQKLVSDYYAKINDLFESRYKFLVTDEIHKYYHEENYANFNGNLGYSCMRHPECQKYMDFYKNYYVKLLILVDKETDKITGRALLWNVKYNDKEYKLVDRVYVTNDNDFTLFTEYCARHGMIERLDYDYFRVDGIEDIIKFEISPKDPSIKHRYAPYLDTFMYYDEDNNMLYNMSGGSNLACLESTDGSIYSNRCQECEEYMDEDESYYVPGVGYVCHNCTDNYSYCQICGNYHTLTLYKDGIHVCENCFETAFSDCNVCGNRHRNNTMSHYQGERHCATCHETFKAPCNCCKAETLIKNMRTNYDYETCNYIYACYDCYSNRPNPFVVEREESDVVEIVDARRVLTFPSLRRAIAVPAGHLSFD